MGNCQAAEAATVVIQHPGGGGKVDRIYWSVSASEVMNANPGHYVAHVVATPTPTPTVTAESGAPVKQLKLLRPDDTLVMGQVYRLVSFEDVLKEFASKKCVKLGRLLKERGPLSSNSRSPCVKTESNHHLAGGSGGSSRGGGVGRLHGGGGHWRPALQSISEQGT